MEKSVKMAELLPVMKIMLENGGTVNFNPRGNSMLPLLHNDGDRVVIKKPDARLKKWDIALYRRSNGEFVLHRVVKVCNTGYYFCGDNQTDCEGIVPDDAIIGVVTSIIRNGKNIDINTSRLYKLYLFVWCRSPLGMWIKKLFLKPIKRFKQLKKLLFPKDNEIKIIVTRYSNEIIEPFQQLEDENTAEAEKVLIKALMAYTIYKHPFKRNFSFLKELLIIMEFYYRQELFSPIDEDFYKIKGENIAIKYYKKFIDTAGNNKYKILKSCLNKINFYFFGGNYVKRKKDLLQIQREILSEI